MPTWTFRRYVTDRNVDPVKAWYEAQDAAVRSAFDTSLLILRATPDWTRKKRVKELTGKHQGLTEIIINIPVKRGIRRRLRPVGIWRPGHGEFILLMGCEKRIRGSVYIPPRAFDIAMGYKAAFDTGRGSLRDHDI